MNITIFGIVWLLILFVALLMGSTKKLIFINFIAITLQSNAVLTIFGFTIGPQIITSMIVTLYFIFFKNIRFRVTSESKSFIILFLVSLISILINERTLNLGNFLYLLMFLTYIINFIVLQDLGKRYSNQNITKFLKNISVFIIVIGFIQVLMKSNIFPNLGILKTLIYSDVNNTSVIFHTKSLNSFYSTFMEPSYAAPFLIIMIIYFFMNDKKNYLMIILLLLSLFLTRSSIGYASFLIIFSLLFILGVERNRVFIVFFMMFLFVLVTIIPLYDIYDSVIFSKSSTSSAITRSNLNKMAIELFFKNPIFGVGYKNSRASSLLYTILAEMGVLGLLAFLNIIRVFLINIRSKNNKTTGSIMVVSVFISMLIGIPDIIYSVLWFSLFVYSLNMSSSNEKNIVEL